MLGEAVAVDQDRGHVQATHHFPLHPTHTERQTDHHTAVFMLMTLVNSIDAVKTI